MGARLNFCRWSILWQCIDSAFEVVPLCTAVWAIQFSSLAFLIGLTTIGRMIVSRVIVSSIVSCCIVAALVSSMIGSMIGGRPIIAITLARRTATAILIVSIVVAPALGSTSSLLEVRQLRGKVHGRFRFAIISRSLPIFLFANRSWAIPPPTGTRILYSHCYTAYCRCSFRSSTCSPFPQ